MWIKALLLFFITQNGGSHVQIQNVSVGQSEKLHEQRCPAPQEKLQYRADARRDPALAGAVLPPPTGVHDHLGRGERETCLGFLPVNENR